jgi:hypothetical protein
MKIFLHRLSKIFSCEFVFLNFANSFLTHDIQESIDLFQLTSVFISISFFWTFGADLRYLGGETPFLLKTSASEAKHKYRGQPVNMKSQRYVKLWEVFLAFLFVVSSLNSDACFSKWFKACLSWKVQHQKKHRRIEHSLDPSLENSDNVFEWIPQRVGVKDLFFSVDTTSSFYRLHFCTRGKCLDDDLWDGFCDEAAYGRST